MKKQWTPIGLLCNLGYTSPNQDKPLTISVIGREKEKWFLTVELNQK
jgi:hypothetical protein